MTARRGGLWVLILAWALADRPASAAEERYAAMLADGTRVQGNDVAAWHDANSKPSLAGRQVFDPQNPFRWLLDRSLSPAAPPPAYVEFTGGDRLAGTVAAWSAGTESSYETWPEHLVVEPDEELHWPEFGGPTALRVGTAWVQRVVWERRPNEEYRPGTAFLRDGRRIEFRSARWTDGAVVLLLNSGIQSFSFGEISEIHLPRADAWQAHYEQLAVLTPSCEARLIHLETTAGSRLTTSTERFEAQHRGDGNKAENRFQRVQPAWSLDPLWVRYSTIRVWNFFAPHQVPLTRVPPVDVEQQSTFGGSWRWQVDRSVHGQTLRSAGSEFGWGFGVHAFHELQFALPPGARLFRVRLGLDQSVGNGGCVRARVALEASPRRQVYESPIIQGSTALHDSGAVSLGSKPQSERLVLTVDPMAAGSPPGADPFDIRDSFLWLEPEIELDPQLVKQEVARRAFRGLPALAEWTINETDASKLQLKNVWEKSETRDPRYRLHLGTTDRFVTLSRKLKIGAEDRWLLLDASRADDASVRSRVHVRIDGRDASEFEVGERKKNEPEPFLVPVDKYQGRTVTVELTQVPDNEQSFVDWRAVALLARRPGLLPVFEDEPEFVAELHNGNGEATLVTETPYSGRAALRVTPDERSNVRLPTLGVPIAEQPRMGEYRYLRFAWRKVGGDQIGLAIGHDGDFGEPNPRNQLRIARLFGKRPSLEVRRRSEKRGTQYGYRYDAGRGEPVGRQALRLDKNPPEEWTVITRDLYSDFGSFTLTGLLFSCPDGEAAEFDQIYVARTTRDFERIPELLGTPPETKADRDVLARAAEPQAFGELVGQVAPGFSCFEADAMLLLKEHRGKANVLRTYPLKQDKPCILRQAFHFAAGKKPKLVATVSHQDKGDWKLVVKANGETVHESMIGESTTKEGWSDVEVDLSKFAGQKVLLEVWNQANNWPNEAAYWSRLEVVER